MATKKKVAAPKKKVAAVKKKRYVVVTTEHRGVFGGYLEGSDSGKSVVLTEARMCVYWSAETRGVVGLAQTGPKDGCRISPAAPRIRLNAVTAVMDASKKAELAWGDEVWR